MDGDGCLFYPDGIIILQHGVNSKSYTSSYQSERCGDTIVHPMKWGLRSTATCLFWCLEDFMFFKYQVQGAESLLNPEFQVFEHPLLDVAGCSVSCFIMNLYNMHSRYTIHIETHWLLSVLQISESGDCLLSVSEILSPLLGWKNGGRCFFFCCAFVSPRGEKTAWGVYLLWPPIWDRLSVRFANRWETWSLFRSSGQDALNIEMTALIRSESQLIIILKMNIHQLVKIYLWFSDRS